MTTEFLFPSEAIEWLDNNIKPGLLTRPVKRVAFPCVVGGAKMVLTANATGRTQPIYDLIEDDGSDPVEIAGKPTSVTVAPGNVAALEALLSGSGIPFPEEEEAPLEEEEMVDYSTPQESAGFVPSAREMDLSFGDEAPTAIPMPELVKTSKRSKKATKEAAPAISFRQKLLDKFRKTLGDVEIPTPEEMFHKFAGNPAVKMIPLRDLAACNHPADLMNKPKGEFSKALAEILENHRDLARRNILNLSAEIDPNRVMALVNVLLRYGRLIQCIEATKLTDEVPHSAQLSSDGKSLEPFDPDALQVVMGRHRCWALGMIYGPDVKVPVMISNLTFKDASEECVEGNRVRAMGKQEQIHYEALQRVLAVGSGLPAQFATLKGNRTAIAKFVVHNTIQIPDQEDFYHPTRLRLGARKSASTITTPFFTTAIEYALSGANMNRATELNETVLQSLNWIVEAFDRLFERIEEEFPLDAERKTVWSYYSSGAFGLLLGEALEPYIKGTAKSSCPATLAAEQVVKMIRGMVENDPDPKDKFQSESPAPLAGYLSLYKSPVNASEVEEDDDDDTIEVINVDDVANSLLG